jgi:hypothetical protein
LNPELVAVLCAGIVALLGVLIVLRLVRPRPAPEPHRIEANRKGVQMECSVCHWALRVDRKELRPLEPVERALIVRSMPAAVKYKLAEYVCPHCEAAHCFNVTSGTPQYLGVNFYEPQQQAAFCNECHKRLASPPWSPGAYDGRLREAPNLNPDYGLECPYCRSICCVACCEKHTRRRTPDGSLQCPRCDRGPQDQFFHVPHN